MGKRRQCEVCGTIAQVWRRAVWLKCDGTSKSTKVCASCSRRAFVFVVSPPQVGRIVVEDGQRKALHDLASPVVLPTDDGIAARVGRGAAELAQRAVDAAAGRQLAEDLRASHVAPSEDAKRNPCPSTNNPMADRCALVAGHAGEHRAGLYVWSDPPPSAGRALAKRARAATRRLAGERCEVPVCTLSRGHDGAHYAGASSAKLAAEARAAAKVKRSGHSKRASAAPTKPCALCNGKGSYPGKPTRGGEVPTIPCEAAGCVKGQVPA